MEGLTKQAIQNHVSEIEDQGFSIMENAIEPDFLKAILDELEYLETARPGGDIPPAPFTGFVTRRWFDLLNDGDVWQRVAIHPWVLSVLQQVLGDGFLISTLGTAVVGHGEEAQTILVMTCFIQCPGRIPTLFVIPCGHCRILPLQAEQLV